MIQRANQAIGQETATPPSPLNLPNAITLSGYAATLWWLSGGSQWLAAWGILADELDGRVARARGETSEFGSLLDWGVDITLTGLVAHKLGWTWALPAITVMQVKMRSEGERPSIGSARALLMLVEMVRRSKKPKAAKRDKRRGR